ncbi:uncharacterized protein DUF4169 [Aquabacter spiritensis]|uniref:Uncharacterized protein DUF4169 n=1 Tax=Aquabacter spiritensis TaxID=933073 RepID=A0A4R3LQ15_9HYPH|nr:uncharacterized protein DUF4169 [Aquabacter spiritensis]
MGEIVNLRRVRKAKARGKAEDQAAQNRIAFGRTKAERAAQDLERQQRTRRLDGHLLTEREKT